MDLKFLMGNAGESAAIDIHFDVNPSVPWHSNGDHPTGINSIEAVKNGISYLALGRVSASEDLLPGSGAAGRRR